MLRPGVGPWTRNLSVELETHVPSADSWAALHQARRRYATAMMHRRDTDPGAPGYHAAVHEVGVAWAQVKRWERATQALRPPVSR